MKESRLFRRAEVPSLTSALNFRHPRYSRIETANHRNSGEDVLQRSNGVVQVLANFFFLSFFFLNDLIGRDSWLLA